MDRDNYMEVHQRKSEPWKVTLVDTGELTQTAGRLGRVSSYVNGESFCFTYGDGVADVDIHALLMHHRRHGGQVTLTAVQQPGRYGALHLDEDVVMHFQEKPDGDNAWINGGFFVVEPDVFEMIDGDSCSWEGHVLPKLAAMGALSAHQHSGFWQPMDTLRDRAKLEDLWANGKAPWKLW
jgi:glucose-1-phosphate cytidylyltransferase